VYGLPGDVSPWDVRFDPLDRAFLDREADGRYRLRVWAEPGLVEGLVVTRRGDLHLGFEMEAVAEVDRFVFWEMVGALEPGDRISLAFRNPAGRGVYACPSGISGSVERHDRWDVPDLEPFTVPAWSQGAVIYQIFPDRFANGDPGNDPPGTVPWGSPPHPGQFQGGDLAGIVAHLDYLAGLGVDVIYLTPVFTSPSTHRYDTVDYYQVDPSLGGNTALADLVHEAHDRGMRLILDASFNHCHPGFFAFQDLVRKGPRSEYRDWFVVRDWPVRIKVRSSVRSWQKKWLPLWSAQAGLEIDHVDDEGPGVEPTYESWYGVASMPRVNLANPEARRYMLDVTAHWISDAGIDGWRMDVARYVDPDFWIDFRQAARKAGPEAYLIGEFMGDAGPWLQGDRFDATMDYTFRDICVGLLARDAIDGRGAADALARLWARYAWPVTLANQNLIGSHDTPRFLTEAGGEMWRARLAMVLQMTFPGSPGLFYGDEVGLEGGMDPGSRGTFPWDPSPESHPLHRHWASLAELRRLEPALVRGEWRLLPSAGDLLAFERREAGRRLAVVINRGRRRRIDLPRSGRVVWGEASLDGKSLNIAGRDAAIVRLGR
jgi:glycosidase